MSSLQCLARDPQKQGWARLTFIVPPDKLEQFKLQEVEVVATLNQLVEGPLDQSKHKLTACAENALTFHVHPGQQCKCAGARQ